MSEAPAPRRDPFQLFLVVACLALCVITVLLAWQNRGLKARVGDLETQLATAGAPRDTLKEGDVVEPFDVVAASGEKTSLTFDGSGGKTLLLVFSSTCPACKQTLPVWSRLMSDGIPEGVKVVGVQTDSPEPLSEVVTFPVYGLGGEHPSMFRRLPFVPSATVLDARGKVAYVGFGVPADDQLDALRRALGS